MSREERRARAREARRQGLVNATQSGKLTPLPRASWPSFRPDLLFEVWTSPALLVGAYEVPGFPGATRLSVSRHDAGDGLTWDDLAWVLHQLYPTSWAVEVYPPAENVHNVANMRHLWVYPQGERPPFDLQPAHRRAT